MSLGLFEFDVIYRFGFVVKLSGLRIKCKLYPRYGFMLSKCQIGLYARSNGDQMTVFSMTTDK